MSDLQRPGGPLDELIKLSRTLIPLKAYPDGRGHIVSLPHVPTGGSCQSMCLLNYETRGLNMNGDHRKLRTDNSYVSNCWQFVSDAVNSVYKADEDFFSSSVVSMNASPLVLPYGSTLEDYVSTENLKIVMSKYKEVVLEVLTYVSGKAVPLSQGSIARLGTMFTAAEMLDNFAGGNVKVKAGTVTVTGNPGTSHPEKILKYKATLSEAKEWRRKVGYLTGRFNSTYVHDIFKGAGGTSGELLRALARHEGCVLGGKNSVAGAGKYSLILGRVAMTMEERGLASVEGAGEFSTKLGRVAMTMEERRLAAVEGAGEFSTKLGRVAMTMEERGLATGFRKRLPQKELTGSVRGSQEQYNAKNKAKRQRQQKRRYKCKSCSYTLAHSNRMSRMPIHLTKNPSCSKLEVYQDNFIEWEGFD